MSENEIVVGSALSAEQQLAMVNEMAKGNYIPRIDLVQSNSVARQQKIADDGEYVYNGTQKLGKSFVFIPIDWRPHAIMFNGKQEFIAESFDPASDTFKTIKQKEAGPKVANERPGSGTQFLGFLPEIGAFAILPLMKTARRHIQPMYTILVAKKAAIVTSCPVTANGNTWQSPIVSPYQGEIADNKKPLPEAFEEAKRMFLQTKATEVKEEAPPETRPR